MASKTFCPLPWLFQAIRNNGDYRICCQANVSPTRGILRHPDGSGANAATTDPELARNLPLMNQARLDMLNGRWPESCLRCQREEAAGLRSRRVYENEFWNGTLNEESAAQRVYEDGRLKAGQNPVRSYDLRFGNKCNLKCRMCGPADSDFWYDDHVELYGPSFKDTGGRVDLSVDSNGHWRASDGGYDWYDQNDGFWRRMEENLSMLEHLHIVGGEPLLLKRHYLLLERIVELGQAGHIVLEYNTNLTLLPERIIELWRRFKSVRVGVSVDGVGAVNEYIRHPTRWSVLEKNLRRLDEVEGPFEVWISATVQVYNIFHLPELIRWPLAMGFKRLNWSKRIPLITSHALHRPDFLNIKCLPRELKIQVEERFARFLVEFGPWLERLEVPLPASIDKLVEGASHLLSGYVKYMWADDFSKRFAEFHEYSRKLDNLRSQSLPLVCPELQL